ncbi:MAG: glycosyltransferase [Nanoarchaeota archaeon]|nr:glycosyltransferase [Nanoarchaeota archaeon]
MTATGREKLKILQVAPIHIPVTPDIKYGGIERVVLALSKSFHRKGHDVITAAPADSNPYGKLFPTLEQSEWSKPRIQGNDPKAYEKHVSMILDYISNNDVDVVHDHTGNFVLTPLFEKALKGCDKLNHIPFIVTPHELRRFAKVSPIKRDNIVFTSLSEYQKNVFSKYVDVQQVINNGVEISAYPYEGNSGDYVFSLGSIERDKGQDLAVKVALMAGVKLKIGGNIADRTFYDLEIAGNPDVEYVGELNDVQKVHYYSGAMFSILPIRIGDCFTLTRIESLACGTPVITLDTGSASEAVKNGETGYVIPYDKKDEDCAIRLMADAIKKVGEINRLGCRQAVEKDFTWNKIADQYVDLYRDSIGRIK